MNEHSPRFEEVKMYYDNNIWKKAAVRKAVLAKWITPDEYQEITGEPYEA